MEFPQQPVQNEEVQNNENSILGSVDRGKEGGRVRREVTEEM